MSMPLLTLKVILPPLAKALLQALRVESQLANDLSWRLLDTTISESLKSAGNRGDLQRQVKEIAQQMAAELRPLFAGQNRQPANQAAIAFALAQTLMQAGLTQTGLAELNFDAEALEQHLLKVNPEGDRGFSAAERDVYQQGVGIISRRLIAAAPTVEGYEQAKTTTVLQRLDEIRAALQVERELAKQAEDHFVRRYRDVVQDELDRLEVFGLPRMDRLTSRQSLSMAYITLSASGRVEAVEKGYLSGLRWGDREAMSDWPELGSRRISSQVDEAICEGRRLVIRGGAGAGKSTLMQWLAVQAASRSFEGKLIGWNAKIPFFIRLRSLVGEGFPPPERFPALIARNIVAQMPEGWVHKYLERGQALVLIDGVDELPRQARKDFFEALQDLVRDFPLATYIVTSRPAGLKSADGGEWQSWEDWVKAEGFENLTLEPMTAPKVEDFVTRWHQALPVSEQCDPDSTAQKLVRQLRQRPELMRLAATPLLCAMICALHLERLETLPNARLQLYRECIDMLLNRRDKGRKIALDESYPIGLNESQKIELLQSLALKFMRNNLSSLETNRVDSHFDRESKKTSLPETVTGNQVRTLFVERAGLLREAVVGQIDFAHRTFQEYLAAKAMLDDDDLGELLQKALNDQWRESIIVVAGLARSKEREDLLYGLLDQGKGNVTTQLKSIFSHEEKENAAKNKKYLHLLAVACLETATMIKPEIRDEVLACAKALMPPKDDDEVAMVVRAGNEVVSILGYEADYDGEAASRCIKSLVSIGTDTAMQALVDYAKATFNSRQDEVDRALGQGWDVFEQDTYLTQVLCHAKRLYLNMTQLSDLFPLSQLSQLQILYLSGTQVSKISPLSQLSQLQILYLSGTQVSDLSPLSQLSQLEHLNLHRTQVSNLSSLSQLSQL
ncbi:MAG: NACHT domain-containing protein, partial [Cyanobacteria bacterium P01_G01_bin.54]